MDIPLKNRNAQTIKNSFENILITSKRKPNLIESDRGKEIYSSILQKLLDINNEKHYSTNSSLGAVFGERYNFTIRNVLEGPVFEKGDVIGLTYCLQ